MNKFCDEVRERSQYCGIDYVKMLTEEDLGVVLAGYLADRAHRGPAKHKGRMGATAPAAEAGPEGAT